MNRCLWIPLLGLTLVACRADDTSRAASSSATPQATESAKPKRETSVRVPVSDLVRTQPLLSKPIDLSVASLPQPYSTNSASRSPNVIPIPQNPVLRVPSGFKVNVFAEGLDRPRWLALTPSGDVLVTETRQNRIRLLRDANRDGVAEVRKSFAGQENGVNLPFGMAFSNTDFFLGNTSEVLRFPYQKGQEQLKGAGKPITQLPGGGYN